jgi:transcriptional regulator with XRE-family HTH domain
MEEQQRIEIGNRIRQLRDASPHTNRSIAEHVGVGERAVANWVAGTTGITYDNAKKVAELFERDATWLWAGDPEATPDLVGALGADPYAEQLDEINRKLDEILKRLPAQPSEPDTQDEDAGPGGPLPGLEDADEDLGQQRQARGQTRSRRRAR